MILLSLSHVIKDITITLLKAMPYCALFISLMATINRIYYIEKNYGGNTPQSTPYTQQKIFEMLKEAFYTILIMVFAIICVLLMIWLEID